MAFKVVQASVDVINHKANIQAVDQPQSAAGAGPYPQSNLARSVSVFFPFSPPSAEGQERERVIAEAKKVLQQALNEIA